MSDLFYRAFEERYYAPRNVIRSLRQQYLPFIAPLELLYPGAVTFDIGCGRGEWLEIMQEHGFHPLGIDLDEGMLESCRQLKLPALQGDAVAHLKDLPDDSHAVISAFHVVEHISFEQLTEVVTQSLRILKPGGLLIMETPNPENIVVGTKNFYLDPTHQRPIPSELLSFLPEHYGFKNIKVLRLQESKASANGMISGLNQVFSGVSPDYAVIAQKDATHSVLEKFSAPFSKTYGISLEEISSHYDNTLKISQNSIEKSIFEIEKKLESIEKKAEVAEIKIRELGEALEREKQISSLALEAKSAHVLGLEHQLIQSKARADALLKSYREIINSTSWKLTAPIRWTILQTRLLLRHGVRARIVSFRSKFQTPSEEPLGSASEQPGAVSPMALPPTPKQSADLTVPMSLRVRQSYAEIKNAMEAFKEEIR